MNENNWLKLPEALVIVNTSMISHIAWEEEEQDVFFPILHMSSGAKISVTEGNYF